MNQATYGARRLDAECLRPTNLPGPDSCIARGSHMGAGPPDHALTLTPDHLVGAGHRHSREVHSRPSSIGWNCQADCFHASE
jgi:hypothetical protein